MVSLLAFAYGTENLHEDEEGHSKLQVKSVQVFSRLIYLLSRLLLVEGDAPAISLNK